MGIAVPSASTRSNAEVSPGKARLAIVAKKNADRPKPERTSPVVVPRCRTNFISVT
jgi:hypothetical protein